jgi:hypothetical protein
MNCPRTMQTVTGSTTQMLGSLAQAKDSH